MAVTPDPAFRFLVNCAAARGGTTAFILFPKGNGGALPDSVPAGWAFSAGVSYQLGDWQKQWVWAFDIPAGETPAVYTVDTVTGIQVTVVADNVDAVTSIAAGRSRGAIITALASTTRLRLEAGTHIWEDDITLPADAIIEADGATIYREVGGTNENRFFVPSGRFQLIGGTYRNLKSGGHLYHNFPRVQGIAQLNRLRVENCDVNQGNAESLAEDCQFHDSRYMAEALHMVRGSRFTGVRGQPWFCTGGSGMGILDCKFDQTARGLVIQTGTPTGIVAMGVHLRGIRRIQHNAGENILIEDSDGSGMVFADIMITDATGPGFMVFAYVGKVPSDIQLWNSLINTDRDSIYLMTQGDVLSGVHIDGVECTGEVVLNGANVNGIDARNVKYRRLPMAAGNDAYNTSYAKRGPVVEVNGGDFDNQTWANCEEVYATGQVVPFAKKT